MRQGRNSGIEIGVFILLYSILFLSFVVDHEGYHFSGGYVALFSVYIAFSLLAILFLIPLLFDRKKYLTFIASLFLMLICVLFIEEFIIERIFWPSTRGRHFPGFFITLVEFSSYVIIPVGMKLILNFVQTRHEKEQLELAIKESELQRLKTQINPHFLFNSLNNLYSLTLKESPESPEVVLRLSNSMRYVLEKGNHDFVPLEDEVNHLKDFISLNELHLENRSEVSFQLRGEIGTKKISPNILSVFVENAFKHSSGLENGIHINIDLEITGDTLRFTVSNNFGERNSLKEMGHGIGMKNVKQRLQLLYPKNHQLDINEKENVYTVVLVLKLKSDA